MSVFSGIAQARAATRGAQIQSQSADAATAEQRRQYDTSRADMAPWLESGRDALSMLDRTAAGDMSGFTASPDYNFRRTEGARDMGNSFAARGGAASGNALRALTEFNSGLASGEFGNWWNRTSQRAGVGQTAATQLGALGQTSAGNIGNLMTQGANARASGLTGAANAQASSAQNAARLFSFYYGMKA